MMIYSAVQRIKVWPWILWQSPLIYLRAKLSVYACIVTKIGDVQYYIAQF